ncbi:DUF2182 domain-containing protein [Actinomycetospora termitidis]|uniref:DUF2182 domain-containing protein n=1 Tax=Actinomycetospora termitidis TaxID=3053470 RepID=A0ABT7MGW0_9PSEU|nr:DUF2182 domain-containing protein [Actinomycetospora sp. Odt1-22]MDL5159922.1 DUF2182 domain-containing protein [Actinomycetospora sp. Odt1-22]
MSAPARARTVDDRLLAGVVLALAALGWLALAWPGSPVAHHEVPTTGPVMPGMPGHDGAHHGGSGASFGTEIGAWVVMVVAMMLPPALPLLRTLSRLVARSPRPTLLLALGMVVFVGVWALAGAVLVGAAAVWRALDPFRTPATTELAAGLVLAVAGAYQLSPLARRCLRACRTPRSFAVAYWRGVRPPWQETARLTGAYAASCVGCCWALMVVSLVVGVAALPVMVVLAVVMTAQRLLPHGRRLVTPTAVATLVLAAAALLGLLPPGVLTV